jgi:hypothetical protein
LRSFLQGYLDPPPVEPGVPLEPEVPLEPLSPPGVAGGVVDESGVDDGGVDGVADGVVADGSDGVVVVVVVEEGVDGDGAVLAGGVTACSSFFLHATNAREESSTAAKREFFITFLSNRCRFERLAGGFRSKCRRRSCEAYSASYCANHIRP